METKTVKQVVALKQKTGLVVNSGVKAGPTIHITRS
jgi:hypothetical protein